MSAELNIQTLSFAEVMARVLNVVHEDPEAQGAFGILPLEQASNGSYFTVCRNWFEVPVCFDAWQGFPLAWSMRMVPEQPVMHWPIIRSAWDPEYSQAAIMCSSIAEIPSTFAAFVEYAPDYHQEMTDFHDAFRGDLEPLADILAFVEPRAAQLGFALDLDPEGEDGPALDAVSEIYAQFAVLAKQADYFGQLQRLRDGQPLSPHEQFTGRNEVLDIIRHRLETKALPQARIALLCELLGFNSPRYEDAKHGPVIYLQHGMESDDFSHFERLRDEIRTLSVDYPGQGPQRDVISMLCTIESFSGYSGEVHLALVDALMHYGEYALAFRCLQVATYWNNRGIGSLKNEACEAHLALRIAEQAGWSDIQAAIRWNLKHAWIEEI
jgi:hypothetical protein